MKQLIVLCTILILAVNFLFFQTIVRYIEPKVLTEQNVVYIITMLIVVVLIVACFKCYEKIK